ncbi:MAG TPA: hypothetical protein VK892_03345 [Pyrinomonadaceae bacterium]|nr:hypothetical protein [Pyrinomonadaceae bacterium]
MLDENLISTLEQSLRQTRNAQNRLIARLNEVEAEADRLRQEIEALENSAEQTQAAILSLLTTIQSGKHTWNLGKNLQVDDDYEIPQDIRHPMRGNLRNQNNHPNYGNNNNQNIPSHGSKNISSNDYRNNNPRANNPVTYLNKPRSVPHISPSLEAVSHRFTDRTITQACTLLLREAAEPLHVNELYNLLVAGGFEFKGNNPTISIAVSLNRNRRFRKVAPGTFDLVMREASREAAS